MSNRIFCFAILMYGVAQEWGSLEEYQMAQRLCHTDSSMLQIWRFLIQTQRFESDNFIIISNYIRDSRGIRAESGIHFVHMCTYYWRQMAFRPEHDIRKATYIKIHDCELNVSCVKIIGPKGTDGTPSVVTSNLYKHNIILVSINTRWRIAKIPFSSHYFKYVYLGCTHTHDVSLTCGSFFLILLHSNWVDRAANAREKYEEYEYT